MGGFAHGATGIGWALTHLAHATGSARHAQLAEEAFAFEDALFDEQEQNWRDLRMMEKHFREKLSKAEFKAIQIKRFHLATHYCNQLSNNAQVLLSWTGYERKQDWIATSSRGIQRNVQDLRVACVQFLSAAFIIRTHLRWWLIRMMLLPFAVPPSFEHLLAAGSWDMITLYEKIQQQAELFSLCFGDEYHDKLMGAM